MCSFGSVEHYSMNVLSVLNLLPCIIRFTALFCSQFSDYCQVTVTTTVFICVNISYEGLDLSVISAQQLSFISHQLILPEAISSHASVFTLYILPIHSFKLLLLSAWGKMCYWELCCFLRFSFFFCFQAELLSCCFVLFY